MSIFMCDTIYTIDDIKAVLYPVFVKHSVKKAVLFGSYVKGMANQNSDVDLLLDSGLRGLQFVGLIEDVRSALDKEVEEGNSLIPWRVLYGLRNKIVHDYEGVNLVLIWDIVKEDLPELNIS